MEQHLDNEPSIDADAILLLFRVKKDYLNLASDRQCVFLSAELHQVLSANIQH